MSDVETWTIELLNELGEREAYYRRKDYDESEYWRGVANGLSEAQDLVQEIQDNE